MFTFVQNYLLLSLGSLFFFNTQIDNLCSGRAAELHLDIMQINILQMKKLLECDKPGTLSPPNDFVPHTTSDLENHFAAINTLE